MTQAHATPTSEEETSHNQRQGCVLAATVAAACLLALIIIPASASAAPGAAAPALDVQANNSSINQTAPYYDNQTAVGNQTGWVPDNVSLEAFGNLATRFGPFIIGTGNQIPGGNTYAGTLVTGLVMVGVFLGSVALTSVGAPGGAVVATVAGYGLVSAGLAPNWLRVVLVIILGTIAAIAVLRTTR